MEIDGLAQGGALHQLHDDVRDAVVFAGVVGRNDVRVRHGRGGDGLAPKAGTERLVLGEPRIEGLDRDQSR